MEDGALRPMGNAGSASLVTILEGVGCGKGEGRPMISPLSDNLRHPTSHNPTCVVGQQTIIISIQLFNFFVRDDHSLSCFVSVNHVSTFDRIIAPCCRRVTFSHARDVLVVVVVALEILKIANALYSYSTEYVFLLVHCPAGAAMIFESIVNCSCGK